jgi:hypothetical protein
MNLSDLVINQNGQLCYISGFARVLEYGEFGFSQNEFLEKIINQVVDASDLDFFAIERGIPDELLEHINLGFNKQYVNLYKGW